jgi:hypothetical protein
MSSKDSSTTNIAELLHLIAEDRAESAPAPAGRTTDDDGLHNKADQRRISGALRHRGRNRAARDEGGHFVAAVHSGMWWYCSPSRSQFAAVAMIIRSSRPELALCWRMQALDPRQTAELRALVDEIGKAIRGAIFFEAPAAHLG